MIQDREDPPRVVQAKAFIAARFSELPGDQSGSWLRNANAALRAVLAGQVVAADKDIAQIARNDPASASVLRQKLAQFGLVPQN